MPNYIEITEDEVADGVTRASTNVDETPIRKITVPTEGDEYHESYYNLLEQADKNTVHFADSQSELPIPEEYDKLVGVAPSELDHVDGLTVHVYRSESGEWVDTFESINKYIDKLEGEVDDMWDYVSLEAYENVGKLEEQVVENKADINTLDGRVDEEVADLHSLIRGSVGDKYVDESTTAEEDIDALESKVDELYDAIC